MSDLGRRIALSSCLVLSSCSAPAAPAAPTPPTSESATSPAAPSPSAIELAAPAGPGSDRLTILDGRLELTLPDATFTWNDEWETGARHRSYLDSYRFELQGCVFTFAARSDGRVRPRELSADDMETRRFVPSEDAAGRLEVLTTHSRHFEVLATRYAAVGAVVFESDGTATDFFLWPHLATDEASVDVEGDVTLESWMSAQRADPRLARCYGEAETILRNALPTVRVLHPFAPIALRFSFGHDVERDEPIEFAGSLPEGWVATPRPSYDASFERLHRRQTWDWNDRGIPQFAQVWRFFGVSPDDAPSGPRGRRRERLFGHDLRFDPQGDFGDCASLEMRDDGVTDTVCLVGSRAEQDELVAILRTFTRVESSAPDGELGEGEEDGDDADELASSCLSRIEDPDGQTNVRARASLRSDVVGTLPNGTEVRPREERGGWLRIDAPHAGWIHQSHVTRACER